MDRQGMPSWERQVQAEQAETDAALRQRILNDNDLEELGWQEYHILQQVGFDLPRPERNRQSFGDYAATGAFWGKYVFIGILIAGFLFAAFRWLTSLTP